MFRIFAKVPQPLQHLKTFSQSIWTLVQWKYGMTGWAKALFRHSFGNNEHWSSGLNLWGSANTQFILILNVYSLYLLSKHTTRRKPIRLNNTSLSWVTHQLRKGEKKWIFQSQKITHQMTAFINYCNLDMIDQALGFDRPAQPRSRKGDNTSETYTGVYLVHPNEEMFLQWLGHQGSEEIQTTMNPRMMSPLNTNVYSVNPPNSKLQRRNFGTPVMKRLLHLQLLT
jgi:hypothetical protein